MFWLHEESNNSTMWALQTLWTAAHALAVFEVLDDLRNLVVDGCARRIMQAACLDRTVTTSYLSTNIDDGNKPF